MSLSHTRTPTTPAHSLPPGGARQDRALLFSRFRLNHVTRDDGSPLYSVTFLGGYGSLVMGSGAGELRQVDAYTQQEVEVVDAHSAPVTLLQVGPWGAAGTATGWSVAVHVAGCVVKPLPPGRRGLCAQK